MHRIVKAIILVVLYMVLILVFALQLMPYLEGVPKGPIAGLAAILFFIGVFYGLYRVMQWALKE